MAIGKEGVYKVREIKNIREAIFGAADDLTAPRVSWPARKPRRKSSFTRSTRSKPWAGRL